MLFIIAFFGLAWSGISLTLGMKTKSSETVFAIGGFLTFPLLFASICSGASQFHAAWMQDVSMVNPISYAVNAVRIFRSRVLLGQCRINFLQESSRSSRLSHCQRRSTFSGKSFPELSDQRLYRSIRWKKSPEWS